MGELWRPRCDDGPSAEAVAGLLCCLFLFLVAFDNEKTCQQTVWNGVHEKLRDKLHLRLIYIIVEPREKR
jgi:hypothetical protein